MTPFWLQVPRPAGVLQIVWGDPPWRSIFLSFPPAKNAIESLSSDQNAAVASSVPASGSSVIESKDRNQTCFWPSEASPTNANRAPSGETAIESRSWRVTFGGGVTRKRTTRGPA